MAHLCLSCITISSAQLKLEAIRSCLLKRFLKLFGRSISSKERFLLLDRNSRMCNKKFCGSNICVIAALVERATNHKCSTSLCLFTPRLTILLSQQSTNKFTLTTAILLDKLLSMKLKKELELVQLTTSFLNFQSLKKSN